MFTGAAYAVGTLVNTCIMSIHGVKQLSHSASLEVNCPHISGSTTSVMEEEVVLQGRKALSQKTQV